MADVVRRSQTAATGLALPLLFFPHAFPNGKSSLLVEDGFQGAGAAVVFTRAANADSDPLGKAVGGHGTDDDAAGL